jgi:hypothetical protein
MCVSNFLISPYHNPSWLPIEEGIDLAREREIESILTLPMDISASGFCRRGMAASAGRFDRQVLVDRPDRKGRLEILKVHVRKVQLERDIDLDTVAALTTGFTGADSSAAADRIMGKRRGRSVELSHSFLRNARAAMPICVPADLRRARVCIAL